MNYFSTLSKLDVLFKHFLDSKYILNPYKVWPHLINSMDLLICAIDWMKLQNMSIFVFVEFNHVKNIKVNWFLYCWYVKVYQSSRNS